MAPDLTWTAATAPLAGSATGEEPSGPLTVPGYTLGEEIGRGGMGLVYHAFDAGLRRQVAVKILHHRYAAHSPTATRFIEEARITGQLQHPGIPPIYHVGELADARPFLAMKLIKGHTLDDLLKQQATFNRLAVFEAMAQAVGYAHAHGVIHRDLKPANVMVGAFGEVQVMDWGLAKVLSATNHDSEVTPSAESQTIIRSDSDAADTQAGSVLGTPAFMAPEQAAGKTGQIDQRSDVFGLGAVLCAMLTGQPPFTGETPHEICLRAVTGHMEPALAALDACGAEPEVIALCKQCLALKRADRPADGNAVAALVASLRQQAEQRAKDAEAARTRAEVQIAEQAKRRRVWLALAATLLLALLLSGGLALWANEKRVAAEAAEFQAEDRRREADAARKRAEEQTALATAVKEFLQFDVLEMADPATRLRDAQLPANAEIKLRDVVLRAAKAIDGKFKDQPLVEAELRGTLGFTLMGLGRVDLAVLQDERAYALYLKHLGLEHRQTLRMMYNLASSYQALERYPEAVKLREQLLAIQQRVLPPEHSDTQWTMNSLANSYMTLGQYEKALKLHSEVLAIRRRLLGTDDPETLRSMHNLARCLAALDRFEEALRLREEVLPLMRHKLGSDHPHTMLAMHALALSRAHAGQKDEALELYEEVRQRRERSMGAAHPGTVEVYWLVIHLLRELKRPEEALARLDGLITIAEKAAATGQPLPKNTLIEACTLQVRICQERGDAAGCRAAATRWEKLMEPTADNLYDAACFHAVAAKVQAQVPGPESARVAKAEADHAMALFTRALAAGYKNLDQVRKDEDLDYLRERPDFKKLLADLNRAK